MKRHAFIIRIVCNDDGGCTGQISEPGAAWMCHFVSSEEMTALLLERLELEGSKPDNKQDATEEQARTAEA